MHNNLLCPRCKRKTVKVNPSNKFHLSNRGFICISPYCMWKGDDLKCP